MRFLLAIALLLVSNFGTAETIEYVHTDPLGSPVAISNQAGNVIERIQYEPFGAVVGGTNGDRPGYTGHVMDTLTLLTFMQQRYYDPVIGRFLSVDPVTAYDNGDIRFFNRYAYAFNNPYRFTDPDGRSGVAFLGGVIAESWNALNGRGFDRKMVIGALRGGYNGEGDGIVGAVIEDASAIATVAGGVGAIRAVGSIAARQGGDQIVSRIAKGALKDDIKGGVRQIVKTGGEKQMNKEFARAIRGVKEGEPIHTSKGVVRIAERADGTKLSARNFSSDGRPTLQVKDPKSDVVVKVRFDK